MNRAKTLLNKLNGAGINEGAAFDMGKIGGVDDFVSEIMPRQKIAVKYVDLKGANVETEFIVNKVSNKPSKNQDYDLTVLEVQALENGQPKGDYTITIAP